MCVRHEGWKTAGTEKASAAKAQGVGDAKHATKPFSQGACREGHQQEQAASLFPSICKHLPCSSQGGHCPSGLCSPLESLQLAHVRFEPILSNIKVIFEVFEQADMVGRLLCALRCK